MGNAKLKWKKFEEGEVANLRFIDSDWSAYIKMKKTSRSLVPEGEIFAIEDNDDVIYGRIEEYIVDGKINDKGEFDIADLDSVFVVTAIARSSPNSKDWRESSLNLKLKRWPRKLALECRSPLPDELTEKQVAYIHKRANLAVKMVDDDSKIERGAR